MNYVQFRRCFDFEILEQFFEEIGIIFKYDFTCCNSCGHTVIIDGYEGVSKSLLGYLFYHSQEADSIKEKLSNNEKIIDVYSGWSTLNNTRDDHFFDRIKLGFNGPNTQFIRPEHESKK